jgi:hypothetical protein
MTVQVFRGGKWYKIYCDESNNNSNNNNNNNNSIQHSPSWEANWFSDSQEIPQILWNPKFHYRIHKFPPNVPIQSQFNPVHVFAFQILKIHLNIILPSTSGSHKWYLPFISLHRKLVCIFPTSSGARHSDLLIILDLITSSDIRWINNTEHIANKIMNI